MNTNSDFLYQIKKMYANSWKYFLKYLAFWHLIPKLTSWRYNIPPGHPAFFHQEVLRRHTREYLLRIPPSNLKILFPNSWKKYLQFQAFWHLMILKLISWRCTIPPSYPSFFHQELHRRHVREHKFRFPPSI